MSEIKHWQSFGEMHQSSAFQEAGKEEFKEVVPFEAEEKGFLKSKTPRRDFLKYLGFSTTAAAIAASCEVPFKKSIPFADMPKDIVPGVADYYATAYINEGDAVGIIAKVRDGRPIKLEGNDLSPITKGGTSARIQASVLDLYDGARLRFPTIDGKEVSFDTFDKTIAADVLPLANPVLLTNTINSPSGLAIIQAFLSKFPNAKHIQYDGVSYTAILLANETCFGKKAIPAYNFDKANIIVSFGADFLGTWLSPVEFAHQYATGRKIEGTKLGTNKHIQFESVASLTGSNADERFLLRPSEIPAAIAGLYQALQGTTPQLGNEQLQKAILKTANLLNANKGKALVVAGSNDVKVQIVVNAINQLLGAYGEIIDWATPYQTKKAIDADFAQLVEAMNAGQVGALYILNSNPVYNWFDSKKFVEGLKKVKATVSFGIKNDETTQLCKYVIPDNHFLESWGDAEPKLGTVLFLQPTIYPLFKTRQWQNSLLKWAGNPVDYADYQKTFWATKLGGEEKYNQTLQAGVNATTSIASAGIFNATAVATTVNELLAMPVGKKIEVQFYEKVAIGAGEGAANPWLQELPDPVTKATWDNYMVISPTLAKTLLNIDLSVDTQADSYEVNPPKPVVELTTNGKKIQLPVLIIPGTHPSTIGIAMGYGRDAKIGRAVVDEDGKTIGVNIFPFTSFQNGTVRYQLAEAAVENTGKKYPIALTQTHNVYTTPQGTRTEVMKELTAAEFKAHPNEILDEREAELKPYGGVKDFREKGTLYGSFASPGVKWGMSVDLNACNGCGACVVACYAENNVPVVGKPEVLRFHDMAWLRIDRYYSGDMENPTVVFQPLMCQHCDNAPCENVCPVAATNHSSEGINQMAYPRCIGTRYCANNCPYKVRRFNWADYTGTSSFKNSQDILNDTVHYMNEDLTRMVLNPDVTVRSRGVIEKCSFCVQRLQEGKLKAKKLGRPLQTGDKSGEWDLKVACQQSCPTNAIVFGNVNDKESAITKARTDNDKRLFYSLEQLHVLPNVNYLAKVRNTDKAGHTEAAKPAQHG